MPQRQTKSAKRQAYLRGLLAEIYAMMYLIFRGYFPVVWRYHNPVGEIDLIVKKKKTLVFVEIKFREHAVDAVLALTPFQLARIQRGIAHFLATHPAYTHYALRLDLIAVDRNGKLVHLDNISI